jgi:uncharacterized protein
MNVIDIIRHFYTDDDDLRHLLLTHSRQVRDRALAIANLPENASLQLNLQRIADGAMLHDIGIVRCDAPSILCRGTEPYIRHGVLGGEMLRAYAAEHPEFKAEPYIRICERHTGSGITAAEVRAQQLPLEERDYLPETLEEQLICLADKFFSKSHPDDVRDLARARRSLEKFGAETLARFDEMCRTFHLAEGR